MGGRLLTAMLHHYQLVDGSAIPLSACKSGYSCRGAIIQLQTIAPVPVIYYLDYCRFAYPATSIRYRKRPLLNFQRVVVLHKCISHKHEYERDRYERE